MKILILSCSTGGGHNAAADAVAQRLLAQGHEVVLTDAFVLKSEKTARRVGETYVKIAKNAPRLFGAAYRVALAISSPKRRSPVYWFNSRMSRRLARYIAQNQFDAVVVSHLFPAQTLTDMRRRGLCDIPSVVVCTDYTCIPFWEETRCDAYILPHGDLKKEYAARGMPPQKLYAYGIPVHEAFTKRGDRAQTRRALGLADAPAYLVMSGSMGFGRVQLLVLELVRKRGPNEQIVVVCGSNERMQRTLTREFSHFSGVHIIGYTDHIADYMDACDVIYTKPGGLTSTEALVKRIPIVHTDPIPGCETRNRAFFASHGLSVTAKGVRAQVELGRQLLTDGARRKTMIDAQKKQGLPDSAARIETLLTLLCAQRQTCGGEQCDKKKSDGRECGRKQYDRKEHDRRQYGGEEYGGKECAR